MQKCNVLITGATGFIGGAIINHLSQEKQYKLSGLVRRPMPSRFASKLERIITADLEDTHADWQALLQGIDVIVHTAARVHVMKDTASNPLAEFRRINVDYTLNLARRAVAAGVRRFIFLSSIKVNGETTQGRPPFNADDIPNPLDDYGLSKLEAEQGLLDIAKKTDLEVVIIRPPLVYGPKVRANFLSMMRWLHRGIPLPLGAIHNRRSLVGLDNLVDLIKVCLTHPGAINQVFLASDGESLSTTELLQRLARSLNKPARLIPIPEGILRLIARAFGQQHLIQRVLDSLEVNIEKTELLLGWKPPLQMDTELYKTAAAFLDDLQHP